MIMKLHPVIKILFPILALIFILSKTGIAEENKTTENIYGRLTALQCDSLIKANETNPNFVILDVRTPLEWDNYHIMGSINRSTGLSDFTSQLDALPKQKLFLLHCQSGGRSAGAFAKMKDLGFAEVYEMIGGINSWNSKGLPTTKITEPRLMLVSYNEIIKGINSDTVKITVTNRANGNLSFKNFTISDIHTTGNNFKSETTLEGAQDYTFSIIHFPEFSGDESIEINLESSGGKIDFNILFKNGVISAVNELQLTELNIFPNPANQKLYLKNSGFNFIEEISIFNIAGQKVMNKSQFSVSNGIDIEQLKNGIYILRIENNNQVISKKFVVKH